jgi:beta-glucosidase
VRRVTLQPGQSQQVAFELSPRDLSFVTARGERRLIPGRYELSVGAGQPGAGAATVSAGYAIDKDIELPP